ncbi:MAG: alpha/beta hydrolase family protein [Planctomycetota bacterium]
MLGPIDEVAYVAHDAVQGRPTGIVLSFHGLGNTELRREPNADELYYGALGGVCALPYTGPWCWMNRAARSMVDELIVALRKKYRLSPRCPVIATGGSMGGTSSLLFTRYSRQGVSRCLANCPAADVTAHFHERPDLPRTFRCAFYGYKEPFAQLLKEHSPLHQVAHFPKVPYFIVHGGKDTAVAQATHSDPIVRAMKKRKLDVEYVVVPAMGHCGPIPHELAARMREFVAAPLQA